MKKTYNKLVRDNIPDILTEQGKKCDWYIEGVFDLYMDALNKKLMEELTEYYASNNPAELMDLVEVVYAICEAHGISITDFHKQRVEKRNIRGGFEKRIILKTVTEE